MLDLKSTARVIGVTDDLNLLTRGEVLGMIQESGALILGDHFELSRSGIHTPTYFQYVLLDNHSVFISQLAREIASHFKVRSWRSLGFREIDSVLVPADDTLSLAMWVGDNLGLELIEVDLDELHYPTQLALDFRIEEGSRVLIVDSLSVTGDRMSRLIEIVEKENKAQVAGIGLFQARFKALELISQWERHYRQVYVMTYLHAFHYDAKTCDFCLQKRPLKYGAEHESRIVPIGGVLQRHIAGA